MSLKTEWWYLYECLFKPQMATSMIIPYTQKDSSDKVRTLVVKELGFGNQTEYIDTYPGNLSDNTAHIIVRCISNSINNSQILKHSIIFDFESGAGQLIKTPTTSELTKCIFFNNLDYDSLWYCSDWNG